MKNIGTKILAVLLCAVMMAAMFPVLPAAAAEGEVWFEDNFDGYEGDVLEAGDVYAFEEAPKLVEAEGRGKVLEFYLEAGVAAVSAGFSIKAEELNRQLSFDVKFDADSLGSWGGIFADVYLDETDGAREQLYAALTGSNSDSIKPGVTLKSHIEYTTPGFAYQKFNFDPDTWYSVRIGNVGNVVAAKVWVAGEAEPDMWSVSGTSEFVPENPNANINMGFLVMDNSAATFQVDNLSVAYLAEDTSMEAAAPEAEEAEEAEENEETEETEEEEEPAEVIRYSISSESADESMGKVTGSGSFMAGAKIRIAAFPEYGHHLEYWTNQDGEVIGYGETYVVDVSEDIHVIGHFAPNEPVIRSFMAEGLTQLPEIDAENRTISLRFASDVDLTNVYPYFYVDTGIEVTHENYAKMDLTAPVTIGVGDTEWTVTAVQNEVMTEFYVDVHRGNDENEGTSPRKAFATLQAAKDAVRGIEEWTGDVVIHVAKGEYILNETLEFGLEDSADKGYAVIWQGTEDANEVVINSAQHLEGQWTESSDVPGLAEGLTAWEYDAAGLEYSRDLYIGGEKAQLATIVTDDEQLGTWRTTDLKYMRITDTGYEINDEYEDMYSWHNPTDIEFVYEVGWTYVIIPIVSIEEGAGGSIVTMKNDAFNGARTKGGMQITDPSSITNCFEGLDTAGEWYFDRAAEKIYYISDGLDPNTVDCVIPTLEQLVTVNGERTGQNDVEWVYGITFKNMTFRYTSYMQPHTYGQVEIQASYCVDLEGKNDYKKTYGAMVANYVEAMRVSGCIFTDLSASGMDFEMGCAGCQVVGNTIEDVCANGITVGSVNSRDAQAYSVYEYVGGLLTEVGAKPNTVTRQNFVFSNRLDGIGLTYKGAVAILGGYVEDITISHNIITNASYTGISAGWGWGNWDGLNMARSDNSLYRFPETAAVQARFVIEYNDISYVCQRLADGGAVYTLSYMGGSKLNNNHMHDNLNVFGGIYLDEGAGGFTEIDGNLVYDVHTIYNYHLVGSFKERQKSMDALVLTGNYLNVAPEDKKADELYAQILSMAGTMPEESGLTPPEIMEVDLTKPDSAVAWYVWVIGAAAVLLIGAAVLVICLRKKKPAAEEAE